MSLQVNRIIHSLSGNLELPSLLADKGIRSYVFEGRWKVYVPKIHLILF